MEEEEGGRRREKRWVIEISEEVILCTRRWAHSELWSKMPNPVSFGCGIHSYRLRNSLDSSQSRFQPPAVKK